MQHYWGMELNVSWVLELFILSFVCQIPATILPCNRKLHFVLNGRSYIVVWDIWTSRVQLNACKTTSIWLRVNSIMFCVWTWPLPIANKSNTHIHTLFLTAIFPGEPLLAGCPLNSPPFIPGLCILLGQA